LGAADVLGARLDAHLGCAARALRPVAAQLARRLDQRLRQWGYSLRERRALLAVAPAAIGTAARGRAAEAFIEQVEYSGRRLAKLNVSPPRLLRALREFRRQTETAARTLGPAVRARLAAALEQWYVAAVLTLNNAFHQVADAEAQTCHELFRHELQSAGLDELLGRLLESLTSFCRADAGQLFLAGPARGCWVLRAQTGRGPARGRLHCGDAVRVPPRADLARPRCSMRRAGELRLALDPGWRESCHTCWSVPLASGGRLKGVMQFAFSKPYDWLPREVEILSVAAERCLLAAGKARLAEQLAASEAQIRELAGRVVQAEEGERRRISSELHDEAGQSLLCVRLQLELLERTLPAGAEALAAATGRPTRPPTPRRSPLHARFPERRSQAHCPGRLPARPGRSEQRRAPFPRLPH
jgi:signal transduction histidine kinase